MYVPCCCWIPIFSLTQISLSLLLLSLDGVTTFADRSFVEYFVALMLFTCCLTLDLEAFFVIGAIVFCFFLLLSDTNVWQMTTKMNSDATPQRGKKRTEIRYSATVPIYVWYFIHICTDSLIRGSRVHMDGQYQFW